MSIICHNPNNNYVSIITLQWLCSALKKKTNNRQDRKIKRATEWLLKTISNHWTTLAPRVESQFGVEEAQRQKAKAERIERRRIRQEEEDRYDDRTCLLPSVGQISLYSLYMYMSL